MNTRPSVEARPLPLNAHMPITLTIYEWVQVSEFLMYAEVPGHRGGCPAGVIRFITEIQDMLFTSASIKAREAALTEEQQHNPFTDMLRAAGVVPPEMTPESFSE